MYLRVFLLVLTFNLFSLSGQIYSPTAIDSLQTAYTDGSPNDNIYVFCSPDANGNPVKGSLTAYSPSGSPNFIFEWRIYDNTIHSYVPYSTDNNVPSSTIANLNSGGYNVIVKDMSSNVIACFTSWVFISDKTISLTSIPPSCDPFNLDGSVTVEEFTYYNPPPPPFIIDANTNIEICFTASHTWVSDLGFYLVGPASCGSPTIALAPNPGFINPVNQICNPGDSVDNLCFSTSASNIFDMCVNGSGVSWTPTGTFASYDPWSLIYGCNATSGGWSVQIYDCVGGDVGYLAQASITFSGMSECGPSSISYDSGPIMSSINDFSCDAVSASVYTVPIANVVPITITNPYTFAWASNNSNVIIPNATTSLSPLIDPAPLQDTWFYLNLTDSFGCTSVDSVLFVYQSTITPIIDPIVDLCIDTGQIQLTANPSGGLWSGPGIVNVNTGMFDVAQAGVGLTSVSYTVVGVCSTVVTKDVVINSLPSILVTPTDESCMNQCNGIIDIVVNNGISPLAYSIDSGLNFSSSSNFNNLCPDTFKLLIKDGNSCTDTASVIINSAPLFQYQTNSFSDTCSMGKGAVMVNLSGGTSPYNYSWADSNGVISNVSNTLLTYDTITGLSGQNYFLTITDGNLCQYLDTVYVNSSSPFTITMPVQTPPSCYGFSDGAITASVNGAIPPLVYSWSTGANGPSINGLVADSLYVLSVMDSSGCQMVQSVILPIPDTPTVSQFISNEKCDKSNGDISLNVVGNNGPFTYSWSGGQGTSNNISGLSAGLYIITITDQNNCQTIKTYQVNNVPSISASINVIDHCLGENIVLDASGGTAGIINWEWATSDGGSETGISPNYLFPDSGAYLVTLVTTDSNGCNDTASVNVNVYPKPEVYFWGFPTVICNNGYVQFADSVIAEQGYTYLWDFGVLGTQTISNPSIYFSQSGSYDVSLTVTSIHGCSTTLGKNSLVSVYNSPTADFFMDPTVTTILNPDVSLNENAVGGTDFIWYVGTDSIAQGPMVDYSFQDTGRFNIGMVVIDVNGCTDTVWQEIYIAPDYSLFAPNAFTPDGDGNNDVFLPVGTFEGVKEFTMYLFNRWGEEIFISNDINIGWDGTYKNTDIMAPDGCYVYLIIVRDYLGRVDEYKGIVFKLE